jgi:hypothetical protein
VTYVALAQLRSPSSLILNNAPAEANLRRDPAINRDILGSSRSWLDFNALRIDPRGRRESQMGSIDASRDSLRRQANAWQIELIPRVAESCRKTTPTKRVE